jgi:multidrug resistance protein MdtO
MISYAGLQIAFAFFYSVFRGYAPDTDLDNVRNRVIGILFGLIVTGLIFQYICPRVAVDRLLDTLRRALRQLARLLAIADAQAPVETAKTEAEALIKEISTEFAQARRHVEPTTRVGSDACGTACKVATRL